MEKQYIYPFVNDSWVIALSKDLAKLGIPSKAGKTVKYKNCLATNEQGRFYLRQQGYVSVQSKTFVEK